MPSPTRARFATPLGPWPHFHRGLHYEQAGVTAKALAAYRQALAASTTTAEAAEAHIRLARVYRASSDWETAIAEANEAIALAEQAGDVDLAAEAMNVRVGVHQLRGEFSDAEKLARQALGRARSPRTRGILLQNLGAVAAQRRDFQIAERFFSASVEAFKAARYELGMCIALNNASAAARDGADHERALELAILATDCARRIDALDILMLALQNQAAALMELGSLDEAETLLGEAIGHYAATKNVLRHAECLEVMAHIHERKPGYSEAAARCYCLAAEMAEKVGDASLLARLRQRLPAAGAA